MRIFVDQCNIFMHDGATCRKNKIVKNFLGEKHSFVGLVRNLTRFKYHGKFVGVVKKCRENSQQAKNYLVTALK